MRGSAPRGTSPDPRDPHVLCRHSAARPTALGERQRQARLSTTTTASTRATSHSSRVRLGPRLRRFRPGSSTATTSPPSPQWRRGLRTGHPPGGAECEAAAADPGRGVAASLGFPNAPGVRRVATSGTPCARHGAPLAELPYRRNVRRAGTLVRPDLSRARSVTV